MLFNVADGLAIASRLSRRISNVTTQMKKYLIAFNEGLPVNDQMSWEAASNIHRHAHKASLTSTDSIPLEVKHEATQKYRLINKSCEEMELLKQEMKNCLEFYHKQIASLMDSNKIILRLIDSDQQNVQRLSGWSSLLCRKMGILRDKWSHLKFLFDQVVQGKDFTQYEVKQ